MTYFDQQFEISRDLVPNVQTPVLCRLIVHRQQIQQLLLIHAHSACQLSQSPVRLIAVFMDDADVKVFLLLVEQRRAKGVELLRCELQYTQPCFVRQGRRGVPWLDLLAEDKFDFLLQGFG